MAELAVTYAGGQWLLFGFFDHITAFLRLAGGLIVKPFNYLISKPSLDDPSKRSSRKVWPIVRGVMIAIPILLIFASLLSSADLIFAQKVESFVEIFRLEKLPEYIFRLFYILIVMYLLMGVFLHAATSKEPDQSTLEKKQRITAFLGFTETTIILGSVVVLFTLFVIIQFRYFFGGSLNIHLDGYTFAEYARKGFSELVTVAVFSLLLLMGLSGISRRENPSQKKVFSGMGIAMVLLVAVMLVSAYQRLVLYESAYGFSELRTYTHVFMIWLGILLVSIMILELAGKEKKFALALIVTAIGFAVSLPLLNVDAFIVRQNVERARKGQDLDVAYLASLGFDAVPELVSLYSDPEISPGLHEKIGASLVCRTELFPPLGPYNWRSYHYSRSKAEQLLSGLKNDLAGYTIQEEDWQISVTTPSGEKLDCQDYGGFD